MASENPFTAQVVLSSSDPADAARARDEFKRAGFTTGAAVANNFSISGPPELFKRYFDPQTGGEQSRTAAAERQPSSFRLDRLPEAVRPLVRDIVTTRVDFGPTSW